MGNAYIDSSFLDRALKFAVDAHSNTERRGKGFPYIVHPMEAVAIVATMTSDQELLAAAALHDTVEDTDVTIDRIRTMFGDRVADIVDAESDKGQDGGADTWRERKQAAIDRLSAASPDAKTVAMGDKLSNMRAIYNDYMVIGDKLWDRFHAPGGIADHEWHYRGLASALSDLSGTSAYAEFVRLIEEVFSGPRPELIDMSEYQVSGDGFTATSYFHEDGKRMIKLYEDFIPAAEPRRELGVSRSLSRMGINIPKALRLVTDGHRTGIEFERILEKRSFARAISQEPSNLEMYSRMFARMCKELHAKECDTAVFHPAKRRFLSAVEISHGFSSSEKEKITGFINSIPDVTTCVHGDMHIGNALMAGSQTYWIDLSDFGYGHPYIDLGMFYMISYGCDDEAMANRLYHMSVGQVRRSWDFFALEYFGGDVDLEKVGEMIAPYAALYMVFFDTRGKLLPEMREFIDKYLINR